MRKVLILCALATLPVTAYAADDSAPSTWFSEILAIWDDIAAVTAEHLGWIDPNSLIGKPGKHAGWIDPAGSQDEAEQVSATTAKHAGWIDPAGLTHDTVPDAAVDASPALSEPIN